MHGRLTSFVQKANQYLLFIAAIIVIATVANNLAKDIFRKKYKEPQVQLIDPSTEEQKPEELVFNMRFVSKLKDVHIFEITTDALFVEDLSDYDGTEQHMIISAGPLGLSSNTVNLLFSKVGEKSKVLLNTNGVITGFTPFNEIATEYQPKLSKNLYTIAENDSNSDGILDDKDATALYVSEYDGTNLQRVLDDIENFQVIEDDNLIIRKQKENNTEFYVYHVVRGELSQLNTNL